jgi:hypothetical protein
MLIKEICAKDTYDLYKYWRIPKKLFNWINWFFGVLIKDSWNLKPKNQFYKTLI